MELSALEGEHMATKAQQAANIANAKKSTGPRTGEGKASSARNATSHGLTARELVIRPEEQDVFGAVVAAHRADLHPDGALQETVFAQLIAAAWNLRRVRILQAELFDGVLDPLADPGLDARCDRLGRYEQRFARAFYRAIAELRRLQTDAAAIAQSVNEEDVPGWSPLIDVRRALLALRRRRHTDLDSVRLTLAGIDAEVAQLAATPMDLPNAA